MIEEEIDRLFVEPNAYANFNFQTNKERKKIVFSEPYETMPSYHINNDFKPIEKQTQEKTKSSPLSFLSGLDIKTLLPFVSLMLNKDKNVDISKLLSSLPKTENNSFISSIISNPEIMKLASSFLTKNKTQPKTKMKSTEFEIKDYVRVD